MCARQRVARVRLRQLIDVLTRSLSFSSSATASCSCSWASRLWDSIKASLVSWLSLACAATPVTFSLSSFSSTSILLSSWRFSCDICNETRHPDQQHSVQNRAWAMGKVAVLNAINSRVSSLSVIVSICPVLVACAWRLCATSATKPEVHNVLHSCTFVKRGQNHGYKQHAKKTWWNLDMWFVRCARRYTYRRTHKHVERSTSLSSFP